MSEEGKRVVLITGASSGFGQATASLLANRGFRVFGTSRKSASPKANGFQMLQLDVTSDESVHACIQDVMEQAKRLDVLVNNAGYVLSSAIEETSLEEAKSQFETNFFGTVRMVNAALPIMRRQKSGQIINISSLAGVIASPFEGFYSASKFAIEGYSEALRHEVKKFNIHVSVVEPGFFRTNIGEAMRFPANPIADYADMHGRVLAVLKERTQSGPGPEFVADTILRIIESKSPRIRYPVGREKRYARIKPFIPRGMFESRVRKFYKLDGK